MRSFYIQDSALAERQMRDSDCSDRSERQGARFSLRESPNARFVHTVLKSTFSPDCRKQILVGMQAVLNFNFRDPDDLPLALVESTFWG